MKKTLDYSTYKCYFTNLRLHREIVDALDQVEFGLLCPLFRACYRASKKTIPQSSLTISVRNDWFPPPASAYSGSSPAAMHSPLFFVFWGISTKYVSCNPLLYRLIGCTSEGRVLTFPLNFYTICLASKLFDFEVNYIAFLSVITNRLP